MPDSDQGPEAPATREGYSNASGYSGVSSYEIGADYIAVLFRDELDVHLYNSLGRQVATRLHEAPGPRRARVERIH